MLEDLTTSKIAYHALRLAVKRLNINFASAVGEKGLEEYVEFKIIKPYLQRELLYKINGDWSDTIKAAIKSVILEEAKKLRMRVLTVEL